jgi:hypothetical protein
MMDSQGLARMELQAEGDISAFAFEGPTLADKATVRKLRAVSVLEGWFFLESSREWYWRDAGGRFWLVHSPRRGVALPQMEFWVPGELKAVNPRSRKAPKIPRDAVGLVQSMGR